MATVKSIYEGDTSAKDGLNENYGVDYVVEYRFAQTDSAKAQSQFQKLIQNLDSVGLACEVRNGDNCAVLVFVRLASPNQLCTEVYHSRVQDWLYGVRSAAPGKEMQKSLDDEPITDAEALRLTYLLITNPANEGGAGITPKHGEWDCVQSIFALHDHKFNKQWVKKLSSKYQLDIKDLTEIRNMFGEKVAFYFAFLQSYFLFLLFPAIFGLSCWFLLGQYSGVYAVVNCLWCVVFVEYWKKQEADLAVQWGVKGVSQIQYPRPQFQHESEAKDPITGETVKVFSLVKRMARQLLQIPFAMVATALLGGMIAMCFGIEIFISEVYAGPFKNYLVFVPTVLLTTIMPTISALLTGFAQRLTDFENYETHDAHEAAMITKIFVMNFITSYVPIFLTAFVYIPFAQLIVPHLDIFQLTVRPFANDEKEMATPNSGSSFHINPDRLTKQVIYFTVTAQIVNFALEVVVPWLKRKVFQQVKTIRANRAARNGGTNIHHAAHDAPEEAAFLARVRDEAELPPYDVTGDLREMITQFGYLSLFSVVWPLTAVSFLVNNFIELRADALKIAIECQRPIAWRADSIGPWLDALGFLTWLGSLSSAAVVYLFSGGGGGALGPKGNPYDIKLWLLLLTVFLSEHIYLLVRVVVRKALARLDSPGAQRERLERYSVRKQYLAEALGPKEAAKAMTGGVALGEKFSLGGSGDEEIKLRVSGGTTAQRFWQRQQDVGEVLAAGLALISEAAPKETKKAQ